MAGQVFGVGKPATPPPTPAFQGPGGDPSGSGIGQAIQHRPSVPINQKAVSDTLSYAEGTWNPKTNSPNYGVRYGDRPGEASLDITKPHPGDVRQSAYGSPYASNASGAFQFKDDTWMEMNDGENSVMSPTNQDRAVGRLIDREGYNYDNSFLEEGSKLSNRWASIPNKQGVSDYGQPTPHTLEELNDFHLDRLIQLQEQDRRRIYELRNR